MTTAQKYYAHTLVKPTKWKAGECPPGKDFYFDCCDCGAKEPAIAGFYSASPEPKFEEILIQELPNGFCKLEMYCEKCWSRLQKTVKVCVC